MSARGNLPKKIDVGGRHEWKRNTYENITLTKLKFLPFRVFYKHWSWDYF